MSFKDVTFPEAEPAAKETLYVEAPKGRSSEGKHPGDAPGDAPGARGDDGDV